LKDSKGSSGVGDMDQAQKAGLKDNRSFGVGSYPELADLVGSHYQ
jgi:hypothetical protein